MKKSLVMLFLLGLMSFQALAYRKSVNTTITTADGGCTFTVKGYIDIGCCPSLSGYDITLDGPCGHLHFVGRMVNPTDGTPWPEDQEPSNAYIMKLIDLDGNKDVTNENPLSQELPPILLELGQRP